MAHKITPPTSCHESWELNALCGKRVKVIFWDNTEYIGVLQRDTLATKCCNPNYDDKRAIGYRLTDGLHFKKSHVKKITEAADK